MKMREFHATLRCEWNAPLPNGHTEVHPLSILILHHPDPPPSRSSLRHLRDLILISFQRFIYVMDETAIWSDSVPVKGWAPIGSHAVVQAGTEHHRDTYAACIRHDGEQGRGVHV